MKCKHVRDLMGPYVYGDLAADEMRNVRLHAQGCEDCQDDLVTRTRVISCLDNNAPELSDEERQRIAWSVKGAVRAEESMREPWRLRPAAAFALATTLLIGLAIGKVITSYTMSTVPRRQQASKPTDSAVPKAVVKITQENDASPSNQTRKAVQKPEDSTTAEIARKIGYMESIVRRSAGFGTASRNREENRRGHTIAPEPPAPVVTDEGAKPDGEIKLPNPTDLNDAQTTE